MFVAKALNNVKSEKQMIVSINVRTRPNRSATGPHSKAIPHPTKNRAKRTPP